MAQMDDIKKYTPEKHHFISLLHHLYEYTIYTICNGSHSQWFTFTMVHNASQWFTMVRSGSQWFAMVHNGSH